MVSERLPCFLAPVQRHNFEAHHCDATLADEIDCCCCWDLVSRRRQHHRLKDVKALAVSLKRLLKLHDNLLLHGKYHPLLLVSPRQAHFLRIYSIGADMDADGIAHPQDVLPVSQEVRMRLR